MAATACGVGRLGAGPEDDRHARGAPVGDRLGAGQQTTIRYSGECSIEIPARRSANSRAIASVAATLACCAFSRRSASSGVTPNCAAYWAASSASASSCVWTACADAALRKRDQQGKQPSHRQRSSIPMLDGNRRRLHGHRPPQRPSISRRRPTSSSRRSSRTSTTKRGTCCSSMAPRRRSAASSSTRSARASSPAGCAGCRCSTAAPSSRAAPAGRASPSRSPRAISNTSATPATAWSAPRSSARAAARTRATSSPTARRRPASAIASIRSASRSRPRASRCPTSSAAARPKANARRRRLEWPIRAAPAPRFHFSCLSSCSLLAALIGGIVARMLPVGAERDCPSRGLLAGPADDSLAPLVRKTAPAVVNIATLQPSPAEQNPLLQDPFFRRYFGVPDAALQPAMAAGSGVIVDGKRGLRHHQLPRRPQRAGSRGRR